MTEQSSNVQVLDVLIVGGGPGGTATAFRAKELGLKAMVIDYDDIMKRIRDYSKDKLILPGFGGGDAMQFPEGGPLIQSLYFSAIDKDNMVRHWKNLYREHDIASKTGFELTDLKEHPEGGFSAICWDHSQRESTTIAAKTIVLAIGCGVPRRFDIPGNTEGISFKLSDPHRFVGEPACVIGGGTSAAEAVIAISRAKASAGDKTAIYWSYRGDRLPRVSKALAEVFFEAYAGCGNIRYFPLSEPSAVITGHDHREYLAIRVDRRSMENRPSESVHLEFPKQQCLACIGEDLPEELLNRIGIELVRGGARGRKRLPVSALLESRRSGVFIVGDLLSQAYFETNDFNADPSTFREIKHRGNIKSALRDGVYVAGVIQQRLAGKKDIQVDVGGVDGPPPGDSATPAQLSNATMASAPLAHPAAPAPAYLIRILPGGVAENEYPLSLEHSVTLGKNHCALNFHDDALLADTHAAIVPKDGKFYLKDRGAPTGTFLKLRPAKAISVEDGDLIRAGRQFLVFRKGNDSTTVTHYDLKGQELGCHNLTTKAMVLGREADLSLDADDNTLSRRHLAIAIQDGKILVKDLKSANGTYFRVQNFVRLNHGHQFQIGQQTLLFSTERDAVLDLGIPAPPAPSVHTSVIQKLPEQLTEPSTTGPSVTFKKLGKTFAAKQGQTICEVAESNGIPIRAECHAGICGSDPVRILSGSEYLQNEVDDQECETLEDLCDLEPGPCRLACKARITGPITVEIV